MHPHAATLSDPLRPSADEAALAWAARVRAGHAQIERLREIDEPGDLYGPLARRFALDPRRTDDPAANTLCSMVRPGETWLDIGAGGGRYALPLALRAGRVVAVEPSAAMLDVLRAGMAEHDIGNVELVEDRWPLSDGSIDAEVALMAHVGYDIEDFAAFLDAAEQAASRRCVVVMRTSSASRASHALWPEVHGQPRLAYPMLPELLVLLLARGVTPEVAIVERGTAGYPSREQLLSSARRLLWLRAGSAKDLVLQAVVEQRASERDGEWSLEWTPMQDAIVSWSPRV